MRAAYTLTCRYGPAKDGRGKNVAFQGGAGSRDTSWSIYSKNKRPPPIVQLCLRWRPAEILWSS